MGGRLAHIYNQCWVTVAKKTLHHSEHAHRWSMRMLQDGAVYEALVRQADSFVAWTNPPKKGVAQWGSCNLFSYFPGLAARAMVESAWSRGWVKGEASPLQPQFGASVYFTSLLGYLYTCIYYIQIIYLSESKCVLYLLYTAYYCLWDIFRFTSSRKFDSPAMPGSCNCLSCSALWTSCAGRASGRWLSVQKG